MGRGYGFECTQPREVQIIGREIKEIRYDKIRVLAKHSPTEIIIMLFDIPRYVLSIFFVVNSISYLIYRSAVRIFIKVICQPRSYQST